VKDANEGKPNFGLSFFPRPFRIIWGFGYLWEIDVSEFVKSLNS
jgi:hypothetical protein